MSDHRHKLDKELERITSRFEKDCGCKKHHKCHSPKPKPKPPCPPPIPPPCPTPTPNYATSLFDYLTGTYVTTPLVPVYKSSNWYDVSSSYSGQYRTGIVNNGGIYYSKDYGQTWTISNAPSLNWYKLSISASGKFQTAVVNNGGIYISGDYLTL